VMRLLENIRGKATDDVTIATAMETGKRIKKVTVLVGNCDGFAGNRMAGAKNRQESAMLFEGVPPSRMDKIMEQFGMAMGSYRVGDTVGLDTAEKIATEREKRTGETPPTLKLLRKMVAEGRCGQKTNKGWYTYREGSRDPIEDPIVATYVSQIAQECGISQRSFEDDEIVERCLLAMINEAAKILEEGIASKSSDLDIIFLYGFGFPVGKGGPCFYADTFVGIPKVVAGIRKYEKMYGKEWKICPLLEEMNMKGLGFKNFKNGRLG